ncbi:hypothetical protein IQ07DRAFT_588617, partial [Pyrenochaeta sp. DS3sAY3a]
MFLHMFLHSLPAYCNVNEMNQTAYMLTAFAFAFPWYFHLACPVSSTFLLL